MKLQIFLAILFAVILAFANTTTTAKADDCPVYGCVDFAGNPRISGKAIDVGAYEYQYPPTSLGVIDTDIDYAFSIVGLIFFSILIIISVIVIVLFIIEFNRLMGG
jgi:hypothetical protein